MAFLDKFEEIEEDEKRDEEDNSIELKDYVKDVVNKELSSVNALEIMKLTKMKLLEIELEKQLLREEKKKTLKELKEYKEKIDAIMLENIKITEEYRKNIEIEAKKIDEKIEKIRSLDEKFIEQLNQERVLKNIISQVSSAVKEEVNKIENKMDEVGTIVDSYFDRVGVTIRNLRTYIVIIVVALFLVIAHDILMFSKIKKETNENYNMVNGIYQMLKGDVKYWYSEVDEKRYISKVEEIEKFKKEEKEKMEKQKINENKKSKK